MFRFAVLSAIFFHTTAFATLTVGVPTIISTNANGGNSLPQIAINNPTGSALVIWQKTFVRQIEAAFLNGVTKVFSSPIIFGTTGSLPQVGIDQNGNGVAVFVNTANQISVAFFVAASQSWSTSFQLTQTGTNTSPRIAVNSVGQVAIIWQTFPSTVQMTSGTTAFSTSPIFTTPIVLSQTGGNPQVSLSNTGSGVAVWQNFSSGQIVSLTLTVS